MRAIAERLILGLTASTPVLLLASSELDGDRFVCGNDWIRHGGPSYMFHDLHCVDLESVAALLAVVVIRSQKSAIGIRLVAISSGPQPTVLLDQGSFDRRRGLTC